MSNLNRRNFLKSIAITGAGVLTPALTDSKISSPRISNTKNPYPFFGIHQQGITTPAQRHIYFLVADLHTHSLSDIKEVFKVWTTYASKLTVGQNVAPYSKNLFLPTLDTGEADSLNPHNLTLTFGVSPSFFDQLGLKSACPKPLKDLPHFPRDQLRKEFSGGDICIQACADDPQVAFHAVRNLVRIARLKITMKWSQMGFNSYENHDTPRNLFAFKDGTVNPSANEFDKVVWVKDGSWLDNGTYLVVRRVQMHLETWDRTHLKAQNDTFGRRRDSGAAYGKNEEFEEPNITAMPEDSHVFLAKKAGMQILRRSFSFASGIDSRTGQFDAGLLFIAFQKDPMQFITIQNALGNIDKMNEYITHIGSGLFACFGGVSKKDGDYLGKSLLG
ncbi:deferrochelatase/peroxidase EfeB [Helicobacter cholecystus]|uniref:Deferrochelatase n=1 Tax=Helicobacter cholecystus TaxID=45498 RepID=A0A3D8IUG4_9HELI|nr:iron uptake transporter deferrochelatase/peroxidase subunit [Helicobacter cholecystus]RDU68927.1 deferrochelatase/peroxidase EfeB [Helicobacter cholecystus]VEJ25912.1 Probable deferrochelatase/peroxidase EfeN precursor [Helicobacter cholecystus]